MPRGDKSLKHFQETRPEIHVIAAGSLLGVVINREKASFPVGKVVIKTLYPLDFEEYLWATDNHPLADEIRRCFNANERMNGALHERAMHLYGDYLSIGGMPAAVAEYVRSNSFLAVRELQDNIITAYIADMSKYAGGQTPSIRTAFMTVPSQLAKPNPKFQYAIIPWK